MQQNRVLRVFEGICSFLSSNLMKQLPALALLLVFSFTAKSAHNQTDSLEQVIANSADTTRVRALTKLAYTLKFSNPQEAERHLFEAIAYADEIDDRRGMVHAYQVLAITYDLRGMYDSATTACENGLKLLSEYKIKDEKLTLSLHNVLALAYYHQGNYRDALAIFLDVLQALEKSKDEKRMAKILINIGLVYHDQKNYDKALEYYFRGMNLSDSMHGPVLSARAANNIGIVYKELERYDEAIRFLNLSLEKKRNTNDLQGIGSTLTNLATIHKRRGEYATAIQYLDSAESIKLRLDDEPGLVIVNDTRAQILMALGKMKDAEKLIRRNLELTQRMGGENKLLAYSTTYEYYKKKGDFALALEWLEKKTAYNDSLFNEVKSKQLAELQTLYEVRKKEKEIASLGQKRQEDAFAKKVLLISLIAVAGVAISVGYLIWFRARKRQQVHELELQLQQNMIENGRLRELELRREIEFKNRSLTSYTMNFVQKSELMDELRKNIKEINAGEPEVRRKLTALCRLIENSYQVDREWEGFKMRFENVHENFFKNLKERCPELTNGDLKLCALLKLNMNMKEAARVLGISPESVKTARYRLRKKLALTADENLVEFIQSMHSDDFQPSRAVA